MSFERALGIETLDEATSVIKMDDDERLTGMQIAIVGEVINRVRDR